MPRRRLLVAYSNASTFTVTTAEYVGAFARESSWEVHYLHVTHGAKPCIDLSLYDAVLFSYCARLCFPGYVSEDFLSILDGYDGVRAICIQDEYDFVERERKGLDRLRPHVVFTCVPKDQQERIYPSSRYPGTDFVQVLTGYVPHGLVQARSGLSIGERPIRIGYRGRDIGSRYGRLSRMKYQIGLVIAEEARLRGMAVDIAMDEASRIYGSNWYYWLGRCRCVLGSESGSNVFDFDGTLVDLCRGVPWESLPLDVRARIDALDGEFRMGQISPRVFEAASMRTALVLYEGRYSDIIRPHEHYVPLAPDHSNLDDVFRAVDDIPALEAMVDRAYAHLISSGMFSYERFVMQVEAALARHMQFPPRGGVAPVDSPSADPNRPALEERPTAVPRCFDSFQLRQLRFQRERLGPVFKDVLKTCLPSSVRRRVRVTLNAAAVPVRAAARSFRRLISGADGRRSEPPSAS